jgi:hypothetical protein
MSEIVWFYVFCWVLLALIPPLMDDYCTRGEFGAWVLIVTVVWGFAVGLTAGAGALGWLA